MDLEEFRRLAREGISTATGSDLPIAQATRMMFEIDPFRWLSGNSCQEADMMTWSQDLMLKGGWPRATDLEVKHQKNLKGEDKWGAKIVVDNERVWFCDLDLDCGRNGAFAIKAPAYVEAAVPLFMGVRIIISENAWNDMEKTAILSHVSRFTRAAGWPVETILAFHRETFSAQYRLSLSDGNTTGTERRYPLGTAPDRVVSDVVLDMPHYLDRRKLFSERSFLG